MEPFGSLAYPKGMGRRELRRNTRQALRFGEGTSWRLMGRRIPQRAPLKGVPAPLKVFGVPVGLIQARFMLMALSSHL